MEQSPEFLSAQQVLNYVRDGKRIAIIDVREDDRAGGHIKGSYHVPAPELLANPSKYLSLADGNDLVVFHCMFSQYRGPACANAFIKSLTERMYEDDDESHNPEVCIMAGGFQAFAKLAMQGNMDAVEEFSNSLYA